MVLDLTSGRLSDAIVHAEKALQSIEARVTELKSGLSGNLKPESRGQGTVDTKDSVKGKGKAGGGKLIRDDLVQNMTKVQMEGELKELEGLKEDLGLKVCLVFDFGYVCTNHSYQIEELKTTPNEPAESAPSMAANAVDKALNRAGGSLVTSVAPVNDLTSMVVKKKKKPTEANGPTKRKADDAESPSEKKAKLDEP